MNKTIITNKLPHMRGIRQAIEELKQLDSNTALTERALRRLVLTGAIPSVRIGAKYLINMDVLISYLFNGTISTENEEQAPGIRMIAE